MTDFRDNPARGCAPGAIHPVVGAVQPSMFFPTAGRSTADAKRVCLDCPVARDCFAYAVTNGEYWGVWAGYDLSSQAERGAARKGLPPPAPRPIPVAAPQTTPRPTITDEQVRELWDRGLSDPQIAAKLGVRRETIRERRNDLGLRALYGSAGKRLEEAAS